MWRWFHFEKLIHSRDITGFVRLGHFSGIPKSRCESFWIVVVMQWSYITERTKDILALAPEGRQHLSITAFGSERGTPRLHEIVRVGVRTKCSPNTELMLFTVPHICDALNAQPVSLCAERYDHLSSLDLADPSSGETIGS